MAKFGERRRALRCRRRPRCMELLTTAAAAQTSRAILRVASLPRAIRNGGERDSGADEEEVWRASGIDHVPIRTKRACSEGAAKPHAGGQAALWRFGGAPASCCSSREAKCAPQLEDVIIAPLQLGKSPPPAEDIATDDIANPSRSRDLNAICHTDLSDGRPVKRCCGGNIKSHPVVQKNPEQVQNELNCVFDYMLLGTRAVHHQMNIRKFCSSTFDDRQRLFGSES